MMEVLATGAIGIAIPYSGGQETEQTLRAKLLEERGLLRQIPETCLTDKMLINSVNDTRNECRGKSANIKMDGASKSAKLLASWVG